MTFTAKLPLVALVGALAIAPAVSAQTATPAAPTNTAPGRTSTAPAQTAPAQTAPGQTAPAAGAPAAPASTAPNPAVGGAAMDASKTIVANAATAPNLTTLVSAVKAAGLAETLSGAGPFTVFAPTNDAFSRLAPGTVDTLLKPENKATLTKVLTYHVVAGTITAADLISRIDAGGGKAVLTTVEGEPLTAAKEGQAVSLTDVNGNKSYIEVPDVRQSNGVVHVVNGVVLPKLN
ncbi:fasciclin domain-containing protein [Sphingomonas aliaeris]|uniref:Fasciclin domain-containing protein n=1 Tax=Sphingomonas aliaeris TaxID=2759526 RepID=A0A974S5C2_9SPHN|nr:fasciclin domain-containing protein [Sphingomonas aliaeris]QQV78429.1 fasciclin domain-containing protein [Sphingomonas aliaeris]